MPCFRGIPRFYHSGGREAQMKGWGERAFPLPRTGLSLVEALRFTDVFPHRGKKEEIVSTRGLSGTKI